MGLRRPEVRILSARPGSRSGASQRIFAAIDPFGAQVRAKRRPKQAGDAGLFRLSPGAGRSHAPAHYWHALTHAHGHKLAASSAWARRLGQDNKVRRLRGTLSGVRLPRVWAVAFFVLTYLVTALLWLPAIRSGEPLTVVMQGRQALPIVIAAVAPSLVAIGLAGAEHRWRGVRDLLAQG